MKVSIITVVFNNKRTVSDAIRSVIGQQYPDLEYIVVDGASTDGTVEIIESFRSRLADFVSEPDGGIYDAMNKGISRATGDVVGILNSDDLYAHPGVVAKVVQCFEETGCDAVYGDLEYVSATDVDKVVRRWKSGHFKPNAFLFGWMPPHPTFFVRKRVYEQHGVFDISLKTSSDYELMLRFLHRYRIKVSYVPELLVKMRVGGVSNSGLGSRLRSNTEDRLAWKVNGLRPYFFTTWLKPLRKISQYI